ncbi:glutamate synthase [Methyloceanibacter methanicus]|uniref:Glutamate synthase n=2 Tax=Methyloceanibacter methanicus TaxID=1774968 RepID=A0A1E3VWT1_9HYPH|nr:glutamate synthase [Methyloceanibacter methanicus]
MDGLNFLSTLFIFVIGLVALFVIGVFLVDVIQTKDAVRRNFPVLGHFRYVFSKLGEFFRQYFFAMDREEMPFNRAEREWVYASSAGHDNTVAFGSTKNLTPVGTVIFVNCPFPTLSEDSVPPPPITFGPECDNPYVTDSIINISGMSFGALSQPAVRALSKGAKLANCWMNTGEGGLSPYHLSGGCDIVFQIGTAKYGVRDADGGLDLNKLRAVAERPQVKMFELKMSQGAKPGKGGILPAVKVTPEIAEIRGIPVHEASISPNGHPEIRNVPQLVDMIERVRDTARKPIGFKAVIGAYGWLDALCEEIKKRGVGSAPDFITIDSGDGGTGAAPMPLMDNVGLPVKEALPMVADVLIRHGLRDRIRLIASGKLVTPAEAAWAYCAGADVVVSARGFMFSLGCIQALKCNKNTCPTGITTHDARLQRGLDPEDKAVRVMNYVERLRYDVGAIAHSCGVPHPRALKRFHCRIVQHNGRSVPLDELYPPVAA